MAKTHWRRAQKAAVIGAAWIAAAACALGQPTPLSVDAPHTYGTGSLTVHVVGAYSFSPADSGTEFGDDGNGGRYWTFGEWSFVAPLVLPAGAIIDHFELDACDQDNFYDISASLIVCTAGSCSDPFGPVSSAGVPGCFRLASNTGSVIVDNDANRSFIQILAHSGTLIFRAVRVHYKLQVSPAPAVATFADVPTTSPQFKFVEALAAAGITAGCGNGNYCPDQAITRGQMAVFLATALGLHFTH
jgi:S-layer family protein